MNLARTTAFNTPIPLIKFGLIGLAVLFLAACDAVPTEALTALQGDRTQNYSGPICGTEDACNFKKYFWGPMAATNTCDNCHDSSEVAPTQFMHEGDVNIAYNQALKVVNPAAPESSAIITKIQNGHQGTCDPATTCAAMTAAVTTFINNWANGGASTSNEEEATAVVLKAPVQNPPGYSKSLPASTDTAYSSALTGFQPIHGLLTQYCNECHVESPVDPKTQPQAPFFAESNINVAYEALRNSQKLDLDTPVNSRLVQRLIEGHNCWDLSAATLESDKYVCATIMRTAIEALANPIKPTTVDDSWVTSTALKLTEGQIASSGVRDDSNTIALYEFKNGSGNTISDTSGVLPVLDLTLSGAADSDFKWVGGWGMEFISSTAQATTSASTKLHDRIIASGEYSIEAWVVPNNVSQGTAGEPARIISYSASHTTRNFTLGQAEYRYEFMQRTNNGTSDANGMPSLITDADDRDLQAAQQHVVVTYDPIYGRKIYVNGQDTGDTDPVGVGDLGGWSNNYALLFGSEAGGEHAWKGKLRLVAIHDSALTAAQVEKNFKAGVGEKFFLLFSVSGKPSTPTDPNCFKNAIPQCFVMYQVSQYDSYSYLFYKPTFVSLNEDLPSTTIAIEGLRIGLNGKEPGAGQAFVNINTNVTASGIRNGVINGDKGQVLSTLGSIIALEKESEFDEFFLTFEQLGSETNTRTPMACGQNGMTCIPQIPADTEASDIGLRTFEEINASMAAVTGIDMNAPGNESVKTTYGLVKQQLPTVETLQGFLPAHQMGVIQVAIQYCNALLEDNGLRDNFYGNGNFDFTADVATAYGSSDSAEKNRMLDALYDRILGLPSTPGDDTTALNNVPSRAELKTELFGPATINPDNLFTKLADNMQTVCTDSDPAVNQDCDNSNARTLAIAKALCTATLSSAALLIQ